MEQKKKKSTQGGMSRDMGVPKHMGMASAHGGHLYMQTNETRNAVIHYRRSPNGKLTEVERTSTGGAGSGTFKPISGQESAPNAFEGAGSVILSPDRRFLFTTNGDDNSVSSFAIGEDGRLTLRDVEATENPVEGRSGTAKSLAYCASKGILYVLHSFGPDHLRLMSVVVLTPDDKLVFVGTTFDEPAPKNPDGSPILWVRRSGGSLRSLNSERLPGCHIPASSTDFGFTSKAIQFSLQSKHTRDRSLINRGMKGDFR